MAQDNGETRKLAIINSKGSLDMAYPGLILANAARMIGIEVLMFFTFWGLNILKKRPGRKAIGNGALSRGFNWLMGGRKKLPLSRMNFGGLSPGLMTGMMKKQNVATLDELMDAAKELGIPLIACEMAMHILGVQQSDLDDAVEDVIGVVTFLEESEDAQVIFI